MCTGHFMWGDWWIIPTVFWGIMMIGFLIFWLRGGFRRWRGRRSFGCCGGGARVEDERPFDLLRARYARGEVSKEEFEAIKADLQH